MKNEYILFMAAINNEKGEIYMYKQIPLLYTWNTKSTKLQFLKIVLSNGSKQTIIC